MKKILKILFTFLLITIVISCNKKKDVEELFNDTRSGVVLIMNNYYYSLRLSNGNKIYFSGIDDNGTIQNLTDDKKQAEANANSLSGTGFFIDSDGTIMTNRHVAEPSLDKDLVIRSLNQIYTYIDRLYQLQMNSLYAKIEAIQRKGVNSQNSYDEYESDYEDYEDENGNEPDIYEDENGEDYHDYDDYQEAQHLNEANRLEKQLIGKINYIKEERDKLYQLSLSDIKIETISKIGVVYDNSILSSDNDVYNTNRCDIKKVSNIDNIDLALLQLRTKCTPSSSYIFNVYSKRDEPLTNKIISLFKSDKTGNLKIGQQLYMLGYNAGMIVANTKQGIKVQMTGGKITQLPDGERLLYNIPTVQGSSGGPVIDEYGNLVAVNFAKLVISDNFNFGIPINKIRTFLDS